MQESPPRRSAVQFADAGVRPTELVHLPGVDFGAASVRRDDAAAAADDGNEYGGDDSLRWRLTQRPERNPSPPPGRRAPALPPRLARADVLPPMPDAVPAAAAAATDVAERWLAGAETPNVLQELMFATLTDVVVHAQGPFAGMVTAALANGAIGIYSTSVTGSMRQVLRIDPINEYAVTALVLGEAAAAVKADAALLSVLYSSGAVHVFVLSGAAALGVSATAEMRITASRPLPAVGAVTAIAAGPFVGTLATGARDGTVRIFSVSIAAGRPGAVLLEARRSGSAVAVLAATMDRTPPGHGRIVAHHADGTLHTILFARYSATPDALRAIAAAAANVHNATVVAATTMLAHTRTNVDYIRAYESNATQRYVAYEAMMSEPGRYGNVAAQMMAAMRVADDYWRYAASLRALHPRLVAEATRLQAAALQSAARLESATRSAELGASGTVAAAALAAPQPRMLPSAACASAGDAQGDFCAPPPPQQPQPPPLAPLDPAQPPSFAPAALPPPPRF